ncbi:MAG TPA: NAD(P)-binding domain-containing protein [Candidatus Limnocylindrales bacterium]
MRIAIIGAGNVGGGLGAAFAAVGHSIVFGVRDPASPKCADALARTPGSTATTFAAAVEGADVVLITIRSEAIAETIPQLPSLDGQIVIDAMNRFTGNPARSTTQDLAELLPGARLAKAFNTTGFENYTTARVRRQPAAMFVATDDPEAKRVAMDLSNEIGFETYDAGGLANAKPLETMVKVWLALTASAGRTIAFAVSRG